MRRASAVAAVLLACFLARPAAVRAQEEPETESERMEKLIEMVGALLVEDEKRPPSVLGDLDLATAPAEVRRIARTIRETPLDISLEDQDALAVVDLLRELSGLNFAVSPKARASLRESKAKVTLSLRGVTLENVLNLLATTLGEYRFSIRYGAVFLARKEESSPKKVTRIYDVRDLIRKPRDFPAPKLALQAPGEKE